MGGEERSEAVGGDTGAGKPGDNRRNRTIRFTDSEWEEVKRAALTMELPAAEYVRQTILALARDPQAAATGAVAGRLAPLIERMFRYTWFLATERRDAMVREGRQGEVDALVAEARAFHESLRRDAAD